MTNRRQIREVDLADTSYSTRNGYNLAEPTAKPPTERHGTTGSVSPETKPGSLPRANVQSDIRPRPVSTDVEAGRAGTNWVTEWLAADNEALKSCLADIPDSGQRDLHSRAWIKSRDKELAALILEVGKKATQEQKVQDDETNLQAWKTATIAEEERCFQRYAEVNIWRKCENFHPSLARFEEASKLFSEVEQLSKEKPLTLIIVPWPVTNLPCEAEASNFRTAMLGVGVESVPVTEAKVKDFFSNACARLSLPHYDELVTAIARAFNEEEWTKKGLLQSICDAGYRKVMADYRKIVEDEVKGRLKLEKFEEAREDEAKGRRVK
ncbi:hypothetical protein H0H81_000329 [Sphagnurus paluster]|uniref:Uncharacterized protein n=1 Tax=Sphagnurus paluster TaxID=117069 RepID=A0A9P7K1Z0_9AGAR|nr:hypothetical protein H0H81_000329 [Sphagnurus paluster]